MSETIEQLQRRVTELQSQLDEATNKAQALKGQPEETTLEEYLRNCHSHVYKSLRIAEKDKLSTGLATKVDGKRYPKLLRPWSDFASLQQDHFDIIQRALGDRRLFPASIITRGSARMAAWRPAAHEQDIVVFEHTAVEYPVREILDKLLADPDIRRDFNATELLFYNHDRELQQPDDVGAADATDREVPERRRSGPSKRVALEREVRPPSTYPDGLAFRKHADGSENLAFVLEYKAAHKLRAGDLKSALVRENLFMEVTQQIHNEKLPTDEALMAQLLADREIAMALMQVFDYMVERGVRYGYVTSGKALVLLHMELDDMQTLYYHLCVPEDADAATGDEVDDEMDDEMDDESGSFKVSRTAVAQLASFCLLTLRFQALRGSALDDLGDTADLKLKRWPESYEEAEEHPEAEDTDAPPSEPSSQESAGSLYEDKTEIGPAAREFSLRSRATCRDTETRRDDEDDEDDGPSRTTPAEGSGTAGSNKREGGPSSGSSDDGDQRMSSNSEAQPTREYCTQACLLGLKRGWDLDESCANVSSHPTVQGSSRHAISANEFTALVGERLRQNPYQNCDAVDPYGQGGKIGAIGALFKLELAPYGYTFVAKGVQSAHLGHLQHESLVYARLESLQGEVVPVHLGIVDLVKGRGYLLPGGARVWHMMLMCWGGELAVRAALPEPELKAEKLRSLREVSREGVMHNDERSPNMLWNEERRRVMIIDFDRATLLPAAKHKRLLTLFGSGKKRKRKDTR